jgi:hypothetical protein
MMASARRPAMNVRLDRVGDVERLERPIVSTRQAKQRDRYRMALLALKGWEAREIAEALSANPNAFQNSPCRTGFIATAIAASTGSRREELRRSPAAA